MEIDIEAILQEKRKRVICPFFEKIDKTVEFNGEEYSITMFVSKKRKKTVKEGLTQGQKVWEYYKRVKGIREDDTNADKELMPRHLRDIGTLLKYSNNDLINCFKAIEATSNWINSKGLEWNLGTVVKKWYELQADIMNVQLTHLSEVERQHLKEMKNGD